MATKNMVVLFDESGTPTIKDDPRTDWFLGVGVAYEQPAEEMIFARCKDACGLANSRPLKNDRIENARALCIAKLLADLPVSIFVSRVNTADLKYREIIVEYEDFGNKARQEFRQVRERSIAQIIHSNILSHCLFHLITGYFEQGGGDAAFAVFIDNWSIPKNDIDIYLKDRATSLNQYISSLCVDYHESKPASISHLELLKEDSNRKRFVDVVASIFSRAYLKRDNQRYSCEAADILQECGKASCSDATQYLINLMQAVMKESQV